MLRIRPLFAAAFVVGLTGAAQAETPRAAIITRGFAHPESVLLGPSLRYVSNIGAELEPLKKDGDGFISIVDAQGRLVERRAFTGLDAPKGMALIADELYVADIDRIVGFDLQTHQQNFVVQMDCEQPCLLNDIAVVDDRLLFSDTLRGRLYDLDPKTRQVTLLTKDIPGANGIAWDKARGEAIIVALGSDFAGGHLFTWSSARGVRQIPNSPFGIFDGVAVLPNGRVLVSDWISFAGRPGAMPDLDPATGTASAFPLQTSIRGPADFSFDEADNRLWIPATLDGAVVILSVPEDYASAQESRFEGRAGLSHTAAVGR